MSEIRMISLDTSSTISGWALYINGKLKKHGIIDFSKDKLQSEKRIKQMKCQIIKVLEEYKPQIVVIEKSCSNNNIKVQRMLSEIVGNTEGWCFINKAEFVALTPNIWRKLVREKEAIPKKRKELKEWSINKVKQLFPCEDIKTDDEADAILIGLARINEFSNLT